MKTGYKTIDNLAKIHTDKIDCVSDERASGDGFWIYLKTPFCNRVSEPWGGLHVIHEQTIGACIKQLKGADKCDCDSCK